MAPSLDQFLFNISHVNRDSFTDEAERFKAKDAATKLLLNLETPWESTFRYTWSTLTLQMSVRVGVFIDLFTKWNQCGGGQKTAAELASMTDCDVELLERLLRHMAAMHVLEEVKEDTYAPTTFSIALGTPGYAHCMQHLYDVQIPGCLNLFKFLKDTNFQDPSDPAYTNWHHHLNGRESFFEWLGHEPNVSRTFGEVMKVYSANKTSWVDIYPTDHLLNLRKPHRAIVVDVGGGLGHDLEKFRTKHPSLPPGSLVLQDLDHQLVEAKKLVGSSIQVMEHDFFTPQPVKGALVYFLHMILHDWPEVKAKEILFNLTIAMEKGYSKVLILESLIGHGKLHPHVTSSDITMMMAFSARERTVARWKTLLESAGLKLVKVWQYPASQESIIEAELA